MCMKKQVSIYVCFIVSVLLLVILLPRQSKTSLDYEVGRPWKYNTLIAGFDFPIHKSEEVMKVERDSVAKHFQPFFSYNNAVSEQKKETLRNDFAAGRFSGVPSSYLNYALNMLSKVYDDGIVPPKEMAELLANGTPVIRVLVGREATSQSTASLLSTRAAYEHIMSADSLNFKHEILAKLHLNDYLVPNLLPDAKKNETALNDQLAALLGNSGMVVTGQRIIDRGEMVTLQQKQILDSYIVESNRQGQDRQNYWWQTGGQVLLIAMCLLIYIMYLLFYRPQLLNDLRHMMLLFSGITGFTLITYLLVRNNFLSVYVVPFAMVPLFVRVFIDSRTASFTLLTMLLLSSLALRTPFEFVLIELGMGLVAVYTLKELTQRAQILRTALIVTVVGLVLQCGYDLMQGVTPKMFDQLRYIYIMVSGVLLLFAYPIMYLIERIFGFTSNVTLTELSTINNSLMRRLSKLAQGTFNHSLQVGNLAAEVADGLGANIQLVRTAALYHDIGKMLNPTFFTENQTGHNPHNDLKDENGVSREEQSAKIIIDHVVQGLKMAEKEGLPRELREFITAHHGRGKVKYFYVQWKNNHPGEEIDEEKFTYPGPNPRTREHAIMMMCDALEAASRSLKEYSDDLLRNLVNKIVDTQVSEGYFEECNISFRDINKAKEILVNALKTIYHTRVAYPELKKERPRFFSFLEGKKG